MASDVAESPAAEQPAGWDRLERAARIAASSLGDWRRRAQQAEAEVARLQAELQQLTALGPLPSAEPEDELRRLRAENAVLSSRVDQARERIRRILSTLSLLESRK